MNILASMVIGIGIGCLTAYFARKRGRQPAIWFFVGFLLGIIGLLLLFVFPNKKLVQQAPQYRANEGHHMSPMPELSVQQEDIIEVSEDGFSMEYIQEEWFYLNTDREQEGPLTFCRLRELWGAGTLKPNSYLWIPTWKEWHRIEEYPDLKTELIDQD